MWRLMAAGAVLGVLALGARQAYPIFKVHRGRDHAQEMERLGRHGDLKGAVAQLKLALRFAPQDAEVLRAAAKFFARGRAASGLEYYSRLVDTGSATAEDRRDYAELALSLNRLDKAGEELTLLLKQNPKDIEALHLLLRQQHRARDEEQAIRTARYVLSLRPEDERSQFDLGSILQESRNPPRDRAEGRRLLWGLAVGDGKLSDAATDLLVPNPDLTVSERGLLLKALQARPGDRLRDQLAMTDLRLDLDPVRSNTLVSEAIRRLGSKADVTNLVMLGTWAGPHGGSATLLELLPLAVARTNALLLPMRAQALADAEKWNELGGMLDDPASPIGAVLTATLHGRLEVARGHLPEAETHFRSALDQPAATSSQIRYLAKATERAGFPQLAIQCWQRLLNEPEETISAALQILRLLEPQEDTPTVLATLRRLNDFIPGDEFVAGERAWHELMLRQNLDFGGRIAEERVAKHPKERQWRFLKALSLLRTGHAGEGLAVIEPELAHWSELPGRLQAVAVVALGENNQREAARGFARKIDTAKLHAPERQMLAPWL
jgi:tetratricopeptide (TPR) repeat protein